MITRRALLCSSLAFSRAQAKQPLNILLILVDDWGATDLGCGGSKFYQTPSMDQLAADV